MPCHYEETPEEIEEQYTKKLRMQLDKRTRYLCTIMSTLDKAHIKKLPLEIRKWWKKHQAWDKKRKGKL